MIDSEQTQKERDNLARIRENQRRSRARRKEYLQELEAKWRACEQKGVEATAEVQAAARQVLVENRRLRALLRARGITDSEISDSKLSPISTAGFPEGMTAAKNLEAMLTAQRSSQPYRKESCGSNTRRSSLAHKLSPSPPSTVQQMPTVEHQSPQIQIRPRPSYPPPPLSDFHDSLFSWSDTTNFSVPSLTSHSSSSSQHTTQIEGCPDQQPLLYNDTFAPSCPWPQAYTTLQTPQEPISCSSVEAANTVRSMGANADPDLDDDLVCPGSSPINSRFNNSLVCDMTSRYPQGALHS